MAMLQGMMMNYPGYVHGAGGNIAGSMQYMGQFGGQWPGAGQQGSSQQAQSQGPQRYTQVRPQVSAQQAQHPYAGAQKGAPHGVSGAPVAAAAGTGTQAGVPARPPSKKLEILSLGASSIFVHAGQNPACKRIHDSSSTVLLCCAVRCCAVLQLEHEAEHKRRIYYTFYTLGLVQCVA
jgi:hypothetical protein